MSVNGAEIQVEDGNWSKLHNHIWEALATAPLSGAEFRCLMFLFRQTYGWKKKQDTISMGQWAKATGLERRSVIRVVQGLLTKKIISRVDNGNRKAATWGFNKYVETWALTEVEAEAEANDQNDTSLPSDQNDTSDEMDTRTNDETDTRSSVQNDTHKRYRNINKETSSDDGPGLVKLIQSHGFAYLDRNATALATQLVEGFGWDRCVAGVDKLKAAHSKQVQTGRRGIAAPLAYLRSVLDGQSAAEEVSNKGFVDNAWQQLENNVPDYMRT